MNPDRIKEIASHRDGHLRVLGPPASGKTAALAARFGSLRDDGANPAVVAFSRHQRERLVERLMPRRFARLGRFPVTTYHRLALDVLGRSGPVRLLGDVEESVVMARVLREVTFESDFAAVPGSEALARTLLSIVHTLEQNGVDGRAAEAALEAAAGRRTRDILRVFLRFEGLLEERGLSTWYGISWRAARALAHGEGADPLGPCDALLIDDFHDIDAGQFSLVAALAPPDGNRAVTVFGDPTGARFGFRGTTSRFLDTVFPQRYRPAEATLMMPAGGPGAVAEALLSETGAVDFAPSHPVSRGNVGELPLFSSSQTGGGTRHDMTLAEDDVAEAQQVARVCAERIASGTPPGEIAVIARDRTRYRLVLAHAFEEFGVPLDTGEPRRYELETFADALLGLMGTRAEERLADVVISSPFYRPLRAAYADRLSLGERRENRDTEDLQRIVSYIKGACIDKKTQALKMGRFLDAGVRAVVHATGADASDDAVAAVARLADAWNQYEDTARRVGGRASVEEFRRHHASRGAAVTVRDPRAVGFYTAREAATLSFRTAFVVGCADGVFPAPESRESYVPYHELESLFESRHVQFYEARNRDERLRDEYGLLLSALTRGREAVHVSSPMKVAGEEVPAPARILGPLAGTGDPERRAEGPRTRAARLLAAAGHGVDTGKRELPPLRIPRVWLGAPLEPRLFSVDVFAMSPSRLGTYVDCPRKLFYNRVLGVEEEPTIYLTLGSLFHDVLDYIGKDFPSRDEFIAGLTPERIEGYVNRVIADSRDLNGALMESLTRYYLQQMVSDVRSLETSRNGAYDIETEAPGKFERGGREYSGVLDRIDSVDGKPRVVIDYKTSASIHKRGSTIRNHMLGLEAEGKPRYWQVPMYSYAARRGDRYPELFCYYVVPPGEKAFVAGVYISDDPGRHEHGDDYDAPPRSHPFDTVSPGALDAVMDEVDTIRDEIFAEREGFPRTDDINKCGYCMFNRVCERRDV